MKRAQNTDKYTIELNHRNHRNGITAVQEYTFAGLNKHLLGIFVKRTLNTSGNVCFEYIRETAAYFAHYSGIGSSAMIMRWVIGEATLKPQYLENLIKYARFYCFYYDKSINSYDYMGEEDFSKLQEVRTAVAKHLRDLDEAEKEVFDLWYIGAIPNNAVHKAVSAVMRMETLRNHKLTEHDIMKIAAMTYRIGVQAERQKRRTTNSRREPERLS